MTWQKRARLVLAAIGIASAIGVYAVMGERARPVPAPVPERSDPTAMIESRGNVLQQFRGTGQDFKIEATRQLTYEGGATKLIGVTVRVANRGGRDYVITAREAQAGERKQELRLNGDVKIVASDGFQIATPEAFFSEADGVVRAPQPFQFSRGKMSGSGIGMTYDRNADVLSIGEKAEVTIRDDADKVTSAFSAGSAVFTRPDHTLALAGNVHVVQGEQVIDAGQATARLTEDDARVTALELRENGQVVGGGRGFDSMAANAIDITYAGDGLAIEGVKLAGAARASMSGTGAGRQIFGEWIDISLAEDGAIRELLGRDGVRLDIAGTPEAPARSVKARTLDAAGAAGKGLTESHFKEAVEYREEATRGGVPRVAHSKTLDISMDGDAVRSATFSGAVEFEQGTTRASAGRVVYEPGRDALNLTRAGEAAWPKIADDRITVEATAIATTLTSQQITAEGNVRTTLRPAAAQRQGAPAGDGGKLPGMLKEGQPANINAQRFSYDGARGAATYTGEAVLFQGETTIRSDQITIDQDSGDMVASGDARSTIVLGSERSTGSAARIVYTDSKRLLSYLGTAPATGRGTAPAPARQAPRPQLNGPQGDISAGRIEILIAASGGAERLEAFDGVELDVDKRKATAGRLTYSAGDGSYRLAGTAAAPVTVVEECRKIVGKTVTFDRTSDRIQVDGNGEIRTETTNGATCAPPPPRPR